MAHSQLLRDALSQALILMVIGNKYRRSDIEKSCAQSNKQNKNLRNDTYEFLLDKVRFFEGRNSFKK